MVKARVLDSFGRLFAISWAKSGVACGWLYQWLERVGEGFSERRRTRQLYNSLRMECDLRDHVQRQIYFLGAYEPIGAELFLSLVHEGDTVVDAGANVGFYTLLLAERVGAQGQVHAFEPVPENFARLQQHVECNHLLGRTRLNARALWHRAETLRFSLAPQHHSNAGGYSASITGDALKQVECEALTLDAYAEASGIRRVHAIKMDIEGAEKFALQGASRILAEQKPVVYLEVCEETCRRFGYSVDDLWAQFRPHGYRIYRIGSLLRSSGWISDFQGVTESNVLLIPPGFEEIGGLADWDDQAIRRKYARYR